MNMYDYGYSYTIGYGFVILAFIITLGAQILVKSRYSKYKKVKCIEGIRGVEVARKILDANGLDNVDIVVVNGELTDHYDPSQKVVRLSHDIYHGTSVASVAVSAHECGHAIQDKDGYVFLRIRSALVPVVNFSSKLGYIVIFIGLAAGLLNLAMFGLILLGAILLFQLVTLPVEFNASSRGKKQIQKLNLISSSSQKGVSSMLFAAALTYVAAVASTLLNILRLFLDIMGRRRN